MNTGGKIKYRDGYKYQLAASWWVDTKLTGHSVRIDGSPGSPPWIELTSNGRLSIASGYAWDGPSGPTWDTSDFMRGSLAHDALYQLLRAGKLGQEQREAADGLLHDLCREDGMGWFRALYVFRGVRAFAAYAAEWRDETVLEAP